MWDLRDTNAKFRSRRAFKQDCAQDSKQEWELRRQNKKFQNENDVAKYPLNFKPNMEMVKLGMNDKNKKMLPKKWDSLL